MTDPSAAPSDGGQIAETAATRVDRGEANILEQARSCQETGCLADAAMLFAKWADAGGDDEEAWHARLQAARCLRILGDEAGLLSQALVAFNQRPHRAEPLYDLARFYRERGMYAASIVFSEAGLVLPLPEQDPLFLDKFVYSAGLREEFSIAANYSRDPAQRDRGHSACNWLALNRAVPAGSRDLARSNLFFYTEAAGVMMPSLAARPVGFTAPDGYQPMNPSVARCGEQIFLVQRCVNYSMTEDGGYQTPNGAPFLTRNFLLRLGNGLDIQSSAEILPPADLPAPAFRDAAAFGDLRLFAWRKGLWCTACYRELTADGWHEQVLARIDNRGPGPCRLTDWRVLRPETPNRHEKNWMPQVVGERLQFIYLCDPTRVLDDQAQTAVETTPAIAAEQFRGGSQAIPFDRGWIALIHEVLWREGRRFYQHRFVWFDEAGVLRRVSRRFYFQKKGVEFAAGLAWHPHGGRLLVSYGVNDNESWIATVESDDIRRALEDVDSLRSSSIRAISGSRTIPTFSPGGEKRFGRAGGISDSLAMTPGGSDEETWYSHWQRSRGFRDAGNEAEFVKTALEAFQLRPQRAEPLHDLARYYLGKSRGDIAIVYADAGQSLPFPEGDRFGVEQSVYHTDLNEAFTIAASYSKDLQEKERGRAICNWLSLNRDIPDWVRGLARLNYNFYAEPARLLMPSIQFYPISIDAPDGFKPGNISIARTRDGFVILIRAVNYDLLESGYFDRHGDTSFRQRTLLARLDEHLRVASSVEILPPEDMPPPQHTDSIGFEDPRPIIWCGNLWCISSVRQLNPEGRAEMVLARIAQTSKGSHVLTDWRLLASGMPVQWEKNWMPQMVGDELRFIYSIDPTRIISESGSLVLQETPPIAVENFRGGSQAIPFDGGWLVVIHEWQVVGTRRHYFHRFVWFDANSRLRRISRRFYFQRIASEFVAGLVWHLTGDKLVISFGIDDHEPTLAVVDAGDVRAILLDVDEHRRAGKRAGERGRSTWEQLTNHRMQHPAVIPRAVI